VCFPFNFDNLRVLYVIFILLLSWCAQAQMMDTLRELLKHKYSIDARLESRNSFIDHRLVSVSGVRVGITFQRKFKIGAGLSWLNSDVVSLTSMPLDPEYLKFAYLAYYMDFVFYKTKRWQLSVPIQAGTGLSWFQNYKPYKLNNNSKYLLLLYEPGITVQFKVFKWAGLGADVAYRFTNRNARQRAISLSSPTYSFKLLFWFDQLFYDLFPKNDLTKRFGPSYW